MWHIFILRFIIIIIIKKTIWICNSDEDFWSLLEKKT